MPRRGFERGAGKEKERRREKAAAAFHIKYDDAGAAARSEQESEQKGDDRVARGVVRCTGSCAVTILYCRMKRLVLAALS